VENDRVATTRLGQGVSARGILAPEAIERTLKALSENVRIAQNAGATIVAVGTSALREASNSEDFLGAARQVLGAPVEVISGTREAALAFRGGVFGLPQLDSDYCLVDVGGGSTEIVRGNGGRVVAAVSLPIGAVRFFERYPLSAPATTEQLACVERAVKYALSTSEVNPAHPIVTTGGTATTLAAIARQIDPYFPALIHGTKLAVNELDELYQRLAKMPFEARIHLKGLQKSRADIIVTGALILKVIADIARVKELTVSAGGVRFGIVQEMYGNISIDYVQYGG